MFESCASYGKVITNGWYGMRGMTRRDESKVIGKVVNMNVESFRGETKEKMYGQSSMYENVMWLGQDDVEEFFF